MIPYVDKIHAAAVRPSHILLVVAMVVAFLAGCRALGVLAAMRWSALALLITLAGVWIYLVARILAALRGGLLHTAFAVISPKGRPILFAAIGALSLLTPPAASVLLIRAVHRLGIHLLR